jgi:hypothetical protein
MNILPFYVELSAEIWSPAGGFFADPKHWRRNTVVAVMCVILYTRPIVLAY